jgi:hypothetical protein
VAEEPIYAPDQLKPSHRRPFQIGGVVVIVALLLMTVGNHEGRIEDLYLVGTAGLVAALLLGDIILRRRGLGR